MSNEETNVPAASAKRRGGDPVRAKARGAVAGQAASPPEKAPAPRTTRSDTLITLMRVEGGATAAELAAAVGWQVHSVRGFIAGNLKKRADLKVSATKTGGVTRYTVTDAEAQPQ